jgi:hypothetical protein
MRLPLLVGLCLFLLVPLRAPAQSFEVTDRVSDVTGVRRIASADLRPLSGSYAGSHAAFRAVYENAPDGGAAWTLTVFGYAPDTTAMGRADSAQLRADGVAVEPLRVASKIRRMDDVVVEVKQITVPRPAFARLARADRVVLSIGPSQFAPSRVLRTDLRLILDRVSTSPSRRASQADPNDTDSSASNEK